MFHFKIDKKKISEKSPIYIIAEAGVNHNGSLSKAKKLIDIAVKAKADAVKFQTFKAENIIVPKGPKAKYHIETTGSNKSLSWFNLLKSQEISLSMHKELIRYCKKKKITFLSTAYDQDSATLLDKLKIHAFKIASTDNDNYPFISFMKKFKKPIILSTAMSTFEEVKFAYQLLKKFNFKKFSIMQCTGNYPTKIENANLNVIDQYKKYFKCPIGFSDHTEGSTAAICAVAKGVKIIEKHFTISKKLNGPDHRMSLEPKELIKYIKSIRIAEKSLGMTDKKILLSEEENKKKLKKSLVAKKFIKKGQRISRSLIDIKRPGHGIRPKDIKKILGKKTNCNIKEHTILNINMLY
ncbi:N-acetylneuraminate synthase family protein [Candidatus Pelagibacter ubique]|nr:N-acetylneuraminate synthase family protein [Candidatus Pelagibacter ubique]